MYSLIITFLQRLLYIHICEMDSKRVIPENEPELIRVNTKSTKLPGIGVSF